MHFCERQKLNYQQLARRKHVITTQWITSNRMSAVNPPVQIWFSCVVPLKADFNEPLSLHAMQSAVRLAQNFTLGCSTHAQSGPPGP